VLHQIDLADPAHPVDRVASGPKGWGRLLDIQGDRMLVTSGWRSAGLDLYRLSASAAPRYDQLVRTLGGSVNSAERKDDQLYRSSGYWGVQTVTLQWLCPPFGGCPAIPPVARLFITADASRLRPSARGRLCPPPTQQEGGE
jgi:hypothetical protein